MGIDIAVVVPSMGRADRVSTKDCIANIILCVPEAEYEEYKKHNSDCEIVTHPDDVKGLPATRQWIHEHYPNVFMVDDDIQYMNRLYVEKGETAHLTKEEAYDVIQYVGNCAKLAGCYLFGLSKEVNPLSYKEFKPIELTGIINGDIGILEGSKLYFHKDAIVTEDYWISGLNAYYHRKAWIDKRFVCQAKATFGNKGGNANFRTMEQEEKDTLFMRKMFGNAITLKGDTKLAKRKHEFQRTLTIPF